MSADVGAWLLFILCQKFTVLPVYVLLTLQELQDKKNSKINTVTINVASYFPVTSIWCYETWKFLYIRCAWITAGIFAFTAYIAIANNTFLKQDFGLSVC